MDGVDERDAGPAESVTRGGPVPVGMSEEGTPQRSLIRVELDGYFRFRADGFRNRHLFASPSLGSTGLLPRFPNLRGIKVWSGRMNDEDIGLQEPIFDFGWTRDWLLESGSDSSSGRYPG